MHSKELPFSEFISLFLWFFFVFFFLLRLKWNSEWPFDWHFLSQWNVWLGLLRWNEDWIEIQNKSSLFQQISSVSIYSVSLNKSLYSPWIFPFFFWLFQLTFNVRVGAFAYEFGPNFILGMSGMLPGIIHSISKDPSGRLASKTFKLPEWIQSLNARCCWRVLVIVVAVASLFSVHSWMQSKYMARK